VLFGSTLFGVLGALLAVPLAATIQIIIREILRYRREQPPPNTQPPANAAPEPAG
jgi:predicted PurR-regulated permease PerM